MLFFGHQIIHLVEVDSTNNYASNLMRQTDMHEGVVVVTENQTNGKGQRGNLWYSEPNKNLTFSIILRPKFLNAQQQFYLNKAVSMGVLDYLESCGVQLATVKWPNDIYVEAKKIGGILIENSINGNRIKHSVVGIGVNVNQSDFDSLNATSLYNCIQQKLDLPSELNKLLGFLEQRYLQIKRDYRSLDALYLSKLLGYNTKRRYLDGTSEYDGVIVEVNELGQLLIQPIEGETKAYNFKEVTFLH